MPSWQRYVCRAQGYPKENWPRMTNESTIRITMVALALLGAWTWLMFGSAELDQIGQLLIFALLFSATCYALSQHLRIGIPIPLPLIVIAALLTAFGIFSLWGSLNSLLLPFLMQVDVKSARIYLLFANGPVVAALIGLVMSYPCISLFGRYWFVPIMLAAAATLLIQFPQWSDPTASEISKAITMVEQASFAVLTPLAAFLLGRACRWLGHRREDRA
jgi:hypothetical protein